jgi:hypothetical protein
MCLRNVRRRLQVIETGGQPIVHSVEELTVRAQRDADVRLPDPLALAGHKVPSPL